MIGYLTGTVFQTSERNILLLVGGVGYSILAPLPTILASEHGKDRSLYIHTHVREDAITLYGFDKDIELETFERLISVSGIGPKSALAMLSVHSPASIAEAVERGDAALLSHTPKTTRILVAAMLLLLPPVGGGGGARLSGQRTGRRTVGG
jgi:Holliday junction DNA helicase RuvA